ncbi:hypothetical protein [Actinomycetospora atypica]|uniref:Uncharacterized protein n=1 Tax=Actinomycetospora atypica TaxID=1290095 RepID=A0ABV9YHQ5_9PSEU
MGLSNRDRRAAKQRKRDERRGVPARPAGGDDLGRGLPAETLEKLLRRTAADLAAGRENALTELRHLLAEHLARRRTQVLAACDAVVADLPPVEVPDVPGVPAGLVAALGGPTAVSAWAEAGGVGTEEAAVATVHLLEHRSRSV